MSMEAERKEGSNVTEFRPKLITSSDGSDINWLMGLKKGTMFAAKRIREKNEDGSPSFLLLTCQVLNKSTSTVVLVENLQEKMIGRVDPVRFTSIYSLQEILWEPEEGKNWPEDYEHDLPHQEHNHGQRDRLPGNDEGETSVSLGDNPTTT